MDEVIIVEKLILCGEKMLKGETMQAVIVHAHVNGERSAGF